jgi:hypothetical protein
MVSKRLSAQDAFRSPSRILTPVSNQMLDQELRQPKSSFTKQRPETPSRASGPTNPEPATAAVESLETSVEDSTPVSTLANEFLQKAGSPEPLVTKQGLSLVYEPSSEPAADLIFVHGLGGTSHSTWSWQHNPDHFWPLWIPQDAELSRIRIFTLGYPASFSRNGLVNIADYSKHLLVSMKEWYFRSGTISGAPIGKVC